MSSDARFPVQGSDDPDSVAALVARVQALEARVSALEGGGAPAIHERAVEAAAESDVALEIPSFSPLAILGLTGQVCLILAGAFFIRMLTDSGSLPRALGVLLGIAYGGVWVVVAGRVAVAQRAAFFLLASALIGFPLLWEAATKFQVIGPRGAALVLVGLVAGLMAVAWRQSLQGLAWMVTLAALLEGWALMLSTRAMEAFTVAFLLLGLGSLWLTYGRRWQSLRWPVALAADGAVLALTMLCAWPGGPPAAYRGLSPLLAILLALGLAAVYLGSFSLRILMRQRKVVFFETAQSALVLAVGFGGAVRVAQATSSGAPLLGMAALLAGLGCYGVGFAFREREAEGAWNFTFFTSLGLALTLLGAVTLMQDAGLSICLVVLGLATLETGLRARRHTLVIHCAVFLACAALASSLIGSSVGAFIGQPSLKGWPFDGVSLGVLGALMVAHVRMVQGREADAIWLHRIPSFLMALFGVAGLGGLCFALVVRVLAPLSLRVGVPAALRTAVLALLVIALAGLSRLWPRTELRWLVFPVLALTGIKLLLEDMPLGQAGPLVLGFALFGAALLLAPRLLRSAEVGPTENPGGPD